ncbi:hypothetical protein BpHYR1_024835 [Brachionus plicatilis]|uniref:Uncharacterized protein n=1 Tax=Brachionus plicatilis TaxID=10195 RepID=A0A3M7PJR7_BRAPC|nr:hypothetical protein BpHYR1_024835 [Brachionus plicatilis]
MIIHFWIYNKKINSAISKCTLQSAHHRNDEFRFIKKSMLTVQNFQFKSSFFSKKRKMSLNGEANSDDLCKPFIPAEHGLEPNWRLTKFSDLKG